MAISKKIFLIATIGLGLNIFNASAYDVVGLKDEVQLISEFASKHDFMIKYKNYNINLKHWLDKQINSTWMTSNSEIIKIASLIKQHNVEKLLSFKARELDNINAISESVVLTLIGICIYIVMNGLIHRAIIDPLEWKIALSKDDLQYQIDKLTHQLEQLSPTA